MCVCSRLLVSLFVRVLRFVQVSVWSARALLYRGNDGRLGTVDGIYFASENKSGVFVLNWFVVGPPSPNTKLMRIVVDWGGV